MKTKAVVILATLLLSTSAIKADDKSYLASDTTATEVPKKKSFGQKLFQPVKWIIKNWSDYDPR